MTIQNLQVLFLGVSLGALFVAVFEIGKREGAKLLAKFIIEEHNG